MHSRHLSEGVTTRRTARSHRRHPFIVHTSNIFAILGLRAMYFLRSRPRVKTPAPLAAE
jgi:predicted tellurium resistance membrane protein TerC